MPITYALKSFGLSFSTPSSLLVWVILEKRDVMNSAARRLPRQIMASLPGRQTKTEDGDNDRDPSDVPLWWYLASAVLALFMTIFAVEYWHAELKWYGVLLACLVALVFYAPVICPSSLAIKTKT